MGAITAVTKLVIALHVMSAYPILLVTAASEIEYAIGIVDEDGLRRLQLDDDEDDDSSSSSPDVDVAVVEEETQGVRHPPHYELNRKSITHSYTGTHNSSCVQVSQAYVVFEREAREF